MDDGKVILMAVHIGTPRAALCSGAGRATCERAARLHRTSSAQRSRVERESMLINFRLTVQYSMALLKSGGPAMFVFNFVLELKLKFNNFPFLTQYGLWNNFQYPR